MPVYQRENSPYWWYSITIGGRRFRGSTGETTERAARIAEAELHAKFSKSGAPIEGWRIRDCFGAYWNDHARDTASGEQIFRQLERMTEFFGADTLVADLTNARCLDFRAARRGGQIRLDGEPGRAVKAQTVNRDFAYLQAALLHMKEVHGQPIPALAFRKLRVAEPEHRIRFAAAGEFERLLKVAHPQLRPIIVAAVTTGLRRANQKLDWHQIDLGGGTITVPRSKGRKPIVVRIGAPLRAALSTTPVADRKGPVFVWTNFRRRWARAVKDAELVDFRFHDLRHTFGSWARQNGADLADICEAMAHSNVAVTMRYAHIKPTEHTTAFDRVADLLAPKKKGRKRA